MSKNTMPFLDSKIERLEAFEDKFSVRIENISFKQFDGGFQIFYELYPADGNELDQNIDINVVLYSLEGKILDKNRTFVLADDFFGFSVISESFFFDNPKDINNIGKIRVYPSL